MLDSLVSELAMNKRKERKLFDSNCKELRIFEYSVDLKLTLKTTLYKITLYHD